MASLSDVSVKVKFLVNNILFGWAWCLVMAQFQFSFMKKIRIGRPEHSLTPQFHTSDNISFLSTHPFKVDVICVSNSKYQAADSQSAFSTPEKMRSPNMVSLFKHCPFKINLLLWGNGMDLKPKANIKYSLPITVLCVLLLSPFRVHLHVTEMESHPGMKKFLFTCEFHSGMKRVEFHPGMKFNLKKTSHWVWKHVKKFSF